MRKIKKIYPFIILLFILNFLLNAPSWSEISNKERKRVSTRILRKIEYKYGPIIDIFPQSPLGKIIKRLTQHTKRKDLRYQISVVPSKEINAITLPNGHILLFKGLIEVLPKKNNNPMAFVIAHEISHMEKYHLEKKLNQALLAGTIIRFLSENSSDIIKILGGITREILTSGYSRDLENEADIEALKLMKKSNFNPKEALIVFDIFNKIKTKKENNPLFPSHPNSKDRYKKITQWLKKNK